jgi:hypothetical protein
MTKAELIKILNDNGYEAVAEAVAYQIQDTFRTASADVLTILCKAVALEDGFIPSDATKLWAMSKTRDMKEITSILSNAASSSVQDIDALLEVLAESNDAFADAFFKYKSLQPTTYQNNKMLEAIVLRSAKSMKEGLINISKTSAIVVNNNVVEIDKAYVRLVNQAVAATQQGITDYNTAIRQTVKKMARGGVRTIQYGSGHKRRLDSAARMNILDGVRAFNQEYRALQGEQYGADGVEISAHSNCAPDHIDVQGRQFTKKAYEKLQNSLERPIGTMNCQHSISYIVMGVSKPAYSNKELNDIKKANAKERTYKDPRGVEHKTTGYGATQVQRRYETKIRTLKDELKAYETVGDTTAAAQAQKQLRAANKNYKRISEELGLSVKLNRTRA